MVFDVTCELVDVIEYINTWEPTCKAPKPGQTARRADRRGNGNGGIRNGLDGCAGALLPGRGERPSASYRPRRGVFRTNPARHFALGSGAHGLSPTTGIFEPLQRLGDMVHARDVVGRVHDLANPAALPHELTAASDGIVFGHRHPGAVKPGGCCVIVARLDEGTNN